MVCADLISLSPFFKMQKKIAVDETLWRVYFGSYKSPLTTRAGLPHRRIFEFRNVLILLSNCPCNYSLLSFHKLLKPKIITTSLGWLTMLRKTTAFRPYSKILQLSSTEKVLVQFHFSVSIDYFSPCVHCYLSHFFSKEYGMQKAVEGKLVQNEQLCTVLKLILLLTFTTS